MAYVELIGPYKDWGRGLMELKAWLESRRARIVGKPIRLFYDNPTETPEDQLHSDARFPIEGEIEPQDKFRIKDLPSGEVAVTRHVGPPDHYARTYGSFLESLLKHGYTFYDPTREIFDDVHPELSPGMGIQIQQLVKKRD